MRNPMVMRNKYGLNTIKVYNFKLVDVVNMWCNCYNK